jgi:hypothetical protein
MANANGVAQSCIDGTPTIKFGTPMAALPKSRTAQRYASAATFKYMGA